MRHILHGCAAAALALLLAVPAFAADSDACPPGGAPPISSPRLADALARGDEVRIVAFGSSSTAGAGASFPWRAYPARLEANLQRRLPNAGITVVNRGVGGEDADNMLRRIERDIIAEAPQLVVWQVGANAALRRMDPAAFQSFLLDGLGRMRRAGIDVVLMDNQRAPRIDARPGHEAYNAMLAEAAAAMSGVELFSRTALMDGWSAAGLPNEAVLVSDGLHHNDRGYACVAEALARALLDGLPPQRVASPR